MKKFYQNEASFLSIRESSGTYNITEHELNLIKKEIKDENVLALYNKMTTSMKAMTDANSSPHRTLSRYINKHHMIVNADGVTYSTHALPKINVTPIKYLTERTYSRTLRIENLKKVREFPKFAEQFLKDFSYQDKKLVLNVSDFYKSKGSNFNHEILLSSVLEHLTNFVDQFNKCGYGELLTVDFSNFPHKEIEVVQKTNSYAEDKSRFYLMAKNSKNEEGFLCLVMTEHHRDTLYRYALTKSLFEAQLFSRMPAITEYTITGKLALNISYDSVIEPTSDFAHEVDIGLQKDKLEASLHTAKASKKHKL